MADFVKTTWVDNSDPAITAAQLNRIEAGILDAIQAWKTGTLAARPAANAASRYWAYFATDDTGGTLYVNFDGANWTKVASGLSAAGGGASGPTIVRGAVNADGTVARGTGFTVAKIAVGRWDITFPAGTFTAAPITTLTIGANSAGPGTELREFSAPTTTLVQVIRYDGAGSNSDGPFNFHAIAP